MRSLKQKIVSILLVVFIGISGVTDTELVLAANNSDAEFSSAAYISIGEPVRGVIDANKISENSMPQSYSFTILSAGKVEINVTAYFARYNIFLYDSEGTRIWRDTENDWKSAVGYRKDTYNLYLEQGTYYIKITSSFYEETSNHYKGNYELLVNYESTETTNQENDNTFDLANDLNLGQQVRGQISLNDNNDTFRFSLSEAGKVSLDMTAYMGRYSIIIYDSDGNELWYTDRNFWNANIGYQKGHYDLYLESGIYYMSVNGYEWRNSTNSDYKSTGYYVLDTFFLPINTNNQENDNSFDKATLMSLGKTYQGVIAINDNFDTYKISLNTKKTYSISMTSYMRYYSIRVFDVDGNDIWHTEYNEWNANVGYCKKKHCLTLGAGTYYIQVNGYRTGTVDKSTGYYKFKMSPLSLKSIKMNTKSITLNKGQYYWLNYKLNPSEVETTCKWKSSNKKVATVKNGLVYAKRKGTATITVITKEGKKATCKVRVK